MDAAPSPSPDQTSAQVRLQRRQEALAAPIIAAVAQHYSLPPEALTRHQGGRPLDQVVLARQLATYLLHDSGVLPSRIAHLLHVKPRAVERDRAVTERLLAEDAALRAVVTQLSDRLDA